MDRRPMLGRVDAAEDAGHLRGVIAGHPLAERLHGGEFFHHGAHLPRGSASARRSVVARLSHYGFGWYDSQE